MEVRFEQGDGLAVACDALVVPITDRGETPDWTGAARTLDDRLSGHLRLLADDVRYSAGKAKTFVLPTLGQVPAKRIVLVGLGKEETPADATITRAYGAALRVARDAGASNIVATLPESSLPRSIAAALEAAAVGAALSSYRFDTYRGSARPESAKGQDVRSLRFIDRGLPEAEANRSLARAGAIARGVELARNLVNEPAASLTPADFAAKARQVAASSGLTIEVLGPEELRAIGAEATLAVGGGSAHPPRLIRLRYDPKDGPTMEGVPGLVGKAITFDTGGYSIKPYEGMLEMKGDMAGGAAVLGAMSALRALDCPKTVLATICAAENMISGTAFRPGDVLRGMNGVTMEILSTDAEGRLVLADGLVDTARRGATEMIDLATLTGAAVVALGDGTTALFASDDTLASRLLASADATGERMWRMPLIDEFEKKIEGDVADIKNSGGRSGGAITAALFLRHFREGLPWAHLDIAGSARQDKPGPLGPKGATGVGVQTLLRYLAPDSSFR
ncbi:MAG: leucyl aminopeptidase [Thermomicrobiales bacterium]